MGDARICGRSSMSNNVNTQAMSRMGGNGFPYTWRLLNEDAYYVNPGNNYFNGCDPLQDILVCERTSSARQRRCPAGPVTGGGASSRQRPP
ncbi:hypothetical protein [Streptomyces sp. NPDC056821]|uniref:hypothetical protein n=1 Tax=unclassified Streptomyces TaxID=2593676 RepID=UPI0036B4890C